MVGTNIQPAVRTRQLPAGLVAPALKGLFGFASFQG